MTTYIYFEIAGEVGTVAFHALLTHAIVDPAVGHTIVFDDVLTNIGNAYSKLHGVFTAPVNGTYMLNLVLSCNNQAVDHAMHVYLKKKPSTIGYVYLDHNAKFWLHSSETTVIHLTQGDDVWAEVIGASGHNVLEPGMHSHFAGFCILGD
jgi:hypothetical protein